MKRLSVLLACLLSAALAVPAQAHGFGHGGHYGRSHGGGGSRWVGPVLGAALVGAAIYAATTPSYVIPSPVVVQQQYVPPNRVTYYCPMAQQYYPNVTTCQVPWQAMSY